MRTASIQHGAEALPPIGWVQFCRDYWNDARNPCNVTSLPAKEVVLDERNWRELLRVNAQVNKEIEPITDMEHWKLADKWDYPDDGKGDCEDFVIEKRQRLIKAGWPRQALLITVVRDQNGDGHAILMVRTDRGDFILDNQVAKVLVWHETGYKFIKRQSAENPNRWVALGGIDTALFTQR